MIKKEFCCDSEWGEWVYERLLLGEHCISFDFFADGNINAELVLEGGGYPCSPLVFTKSGQLESFAGKYICDYASKKLHIDLVVRPKDDCIDVYIDGKIVLDSWRADLMRDKWFYKCIWPDKCIDYRFRFRSDNGARITIDRLEAYETDITPQYYFVKSPRREPRKFDRTIKFTDRSVFGSDSAQREFLAGKAAIHLRSGVVYANGQKRRFAAAEPVGGDYIISAAAACALFGREFSADVPLFETAAALETTVKLDETAISGGMAVIADGDFAMPEGAELQRLNDLIFYERPTPEKLAADYARQNAGKAHPRLMSDGADFERFRREVKTDRRKKRWFAQLCVHCEELMRRPTLRYELRDGFRLMYVSDEFEELMLCMGMMYRITGDGKYAADAWRHIEAVVHFVDWNPYHHIDVGIMAIGMAVAYDWMYDFWSDEQRQLMEQAVRDNLFYISNLSYEGDRVNMGGIDMENNHNAMCNGGVLMAAIAVWDTSPELCAKMAANAIRGLELMMWHFAPEGAWYEGPQYAGVTIDYVSRILASLKTAFGDCYCMDLVQGVDKAAEYMSYSQSDISCYNFADCDYGIATSAGLFLLYDMYKIRGVKEMTAERDFGADMKKSDALVHCIEWYDTSDEAGGETLALDKRYAGEEIITLRDSWNSGQTFVGIKAGRVLYDHSHMEAGSFVYDALGVRWAWDMGRDDYNLPHYWWPVERRFDIFRLRDEGHNTVLINPQTEPGYRLDAAAHVTGFASSGVGALVKIDMSEVLGKRVKSARRGYLFTNNRKTLVVRDDIEPAEKAEIYWLMYTRADIAVRENEVILTDRDDREKRVRLTFDTGGAPYELYSEDAQPFAWSPKVDGQQTNIDFCKFLDFKRVVCRVKTEVACSITAKIEPENALPLADFAVGIDEWSI